jgi:hypothetical protein
MPFDGTPKRLGARNAAIVAAREARPVLPPNWGASLAARPVFAGEAAPPPPAARPLEPDDLATLARLARRDTMQDTVMAFLGLLAERGMALPRNRDMADALGMDGPEGLARFQALLDRLGKGKFILRWTPPQIGSRAAQRAFQLVETGVVLMSAACNPALVRFAP